MEDKLITLFNNKVPRIILLNLLSKKETYLSKISRETSLERGWISKNIKKLEEEKLLIKEPKYKDDRKIIIKLTDKGRNIAIKLFELSEL